jgi:hypothetical protein
MYPFTTVAMGPDPMEPVVPLLPISSVPWVIVVVPL